MSVIKVSQFVKLVPEHARPLLPADLRNFRVALMPWLSQVYYQDKLLHYELVKLPPRYGESRCELGLHFESRDHALNTHYLRGFEHYLFEIREELGENWHAEQWDRGWTKVYTTFDYTNMDEECLEQTAQLLARSMIKLQPIFDMLTAQRSNRKAR
jgi:hypothetical protein